MCECYTEICVCMYNVISHYRPTRTFLCRLKRQQDIYQYIASFVQHYQTEMLAGKELNANVGSNSS